MGRTTLFGGLALCVGLSLACDSRTADEREAGREAQEAARDTASADAPRVVPEPAVETGCLTESDGRFVLTSLEGQGQGDDPRATTESFQLTGNADEMRPHIGREVRVTGEVEPARVAEVREITPAPAPPAGTSGRTDGDAPQVNTESQTRFEVRTMRVQSVTATGDDCASAAALPTEGRR